MQLKAMSERERSLPQALAGSTPTTLPAPTPTPPPANGTGLPSRMASPAAVVPLASAPTATAVAAAPAAAGLDPMHSSGEPIPEGSAPSLSLASLFAPARPSTVLPEPVMSPTPAAPPVAPPTDAGTPTVAPVTSTRGPPVASTPAAAAAAASVATVAAATPAKAAAASRSLKRPRPSAEDKKAATIGVQGRITHRRPSLGQSPPRAKSNEAITPSATGGGSRRGPHRGSGSSPASPVSPRGHKGSFQRGGSTEQFAGSMSRQRRTSDGAASSDGACARSRGSSEERGGQSHGRKRRARGRGKQHREGSDGMRGRRGAFAPASASGLPPPPPLPAQRRSVEPGCAAPPFMRSLQPRSSTFVELLCVLCCSGARAGMARWQRRHTQPRWQAAHCRHHHPCGTSTTVPNLALKPGPGRCGRCHRRTWRALHVRSQARRRTARLQQLVRGNACQRRRVTAMPPTYHHHLRSGRAAPKGARHRQCVARHPCAWVRLLLTSLFEGNRAPLHRSAGVQSTWV